MPSYDLVLFEEPLTEAKDLSSLSATITGVLALLGVVVTASVTWIVAARQRSGKVSTTEAETLWEEGKQMRSELREEITSLRQEIISMRIEKMALSDETRIMREEMAALRAEVVVLRKEAKAAGEENERLKARLSTIEGHA